MHPGIQYHPAGDADQRELESILILQNNQLTKIIIRKNTSQNTYWPFGRAKPPHPGVRYPPAGNADQRELESILIFKNNQLTKIIIEGNTSQNTYRPFGQAKPTHPRIQYHPPGDANQRELESILILQNNQLAKIITQSNIK
jgi:hypothetical protein